MVKRTATITPDTVNGIPARVRLHTIRVFLSYSSKDKNLVGELKEALESNGFEVFLAHEDIEPSKDWQEEIIRNLEECNIFIPIISKNFKASCWTDQESGIAFVGDKLIIPVNIGLVPYGFIGRYQALKFDGNISHACEKIVEAIIKFPRFELRYFFIKRFVESGHFSEANSRAGKLKLYESFTDDQINEIIRGYVNNVEIRGGFESRPFVDSLVKKYADIIDPGLKEEYEACPETQRARAQAVPILKKADIPPQRDKIPEDRLDARADLMRVLDAMAYLKDPEIKRKLEDLR